MTTEQRRLARTVAVSDELPVLMTEPIATRNASRLSSGDADSWTALVRG